MTAAKTPTAGLRRINAGTGHRYTLDGEKAWGVTTAIGAGLPKPALVGWAGRVTAEYVVERLDLDGDRVTANRLIEDLRAFNRTRKWPEKNMDSALPRIGASKLLADIRYAASTEAALKGTDVHAIAARIADGQEVDVPEPLLRHVDAYLAFLNEFDVDIETVEFVCGNRRWRYAGTGDLICIIDGERWLADIKTGTGVYGETGLQLAAYGWAEFYLGPDGDEVPMPKIDRYGVVHVRADGYDLVPFDVDQNDWRQFLYCLATARWVEERDSQKATRPIKLDALRRSVVA